MSAITLYNYDLDENCYRVRLLLSMLRLPWKTVAVDMFPGGEQTQPAMLAINPAGTLPVLIDDGLTLCGTAAILAYLARTYDAAGVWLPDTPSAFGAVQMWLEFSVTHLQPAIASRLKALFNAPGDEATLRAQARHALRIMDDHMTLRHFDGAAWFVGETATIADLALFPSFALSRDFGIDHDEFPALRLWIRRFRALKGFHTMPGIPDYH